MNLSDTTLITGIKSGDYQKFNILFFRYYACLCSFVSGIVKDQLAAEDIIQDLFIRIWEKRSNLQIHENVAGFLYTAAKNAALNHLRGEKSRKNLQLNIPKVDLSVDGEFLEHEEFKRMLNECIDRLPDRCRQVFVMERMEGYKQKEISEKLDISVKTIKNQLWKAVKYLKACLEKNNSM